MAVHFSPESLKFLRGLARHNDRDWFNARKPVYESELKAPMLALIEEINHAFESFAPDHLRQPHKVMMRIYRDIRFSKNKQPYKTHLAAWWSRHGMEKTSGGGYYLQVGPGGVTVAAGVYMPEREQLLALRRWMADHHVEYRKLISGIQKQGGLRPPMVHSEADALTRMPKGFPGDHPADELLRAQNWGLSCTLPAQLALAPGLLKEVTRRFQVCAPMIDVLNHAILGDDSGAKTHRRVNANALL